MHVYYIVLQCNQTPLLYSTYHALEVFTNLHGAVYGLPLGAPPASAVEVADVRQVAAAAGKRGNELARPALLHHPLQPRVLLCAHITVL